MGQVIMATGKTLCFMLCLLVYDRAYGSQTPLRLSAGNNYDVEAEDCTKNTGDQQIAGCTLVIESGRWQGVGVAWAYYYRGNAKERKGDFDDAIADYNHAIELDPKNSRLYVSRGGAKERKGDHDGAEADANRAIELDPLSSAAYIILGNARYGRNDLDKAVDDYNRAIQLDPKSAYAYISRGLAKGKKGDVDGAIADFNRVIDLSPQNASAYAGRGIEKGKIGDLNGALADFNRATEVDPRNALAYAGRALAKRESGDLEGSITDDDRAIELEPRYSVVYRQRGEAFFFKGDFARAASDLIRAQQLRPDAYAAIWLYLVRSRAKMDGLTELAVNAAKLDKAKWPAPIIAFYLANGTPASLLETAKHPDPRTTKEQVCEANFYLAEWHLLRNDRNQAVPLLRAAAEQCPFGFIERGDAITELKRLKAP